MNRVFVPDINAFCTRWAGWKNPRHRDLAIDHRVRPIFCADAWGLEKGGGCYAILHRGRAARMYVLLIGRSRSLGWAVRKVARDYEILDFYFSALFLDSHWHSLEYTNDMINLYCPPWNMPRGDASR